MRGLLVESGVRPQISPVALFASVTVWGLSFVAVSAQRAANVRTVAASEAAAELVRYVEPPLPSAEGDPLGGLDFSPGHGTVATKQGSGGSGHAGHRARAKMKQTAPLPPEKPPGDGGLVYIEDEVDTPVARDPGSAAPEYPKYLEETRVEGFVIAEYIVDTTGRADSSSLHIDMYTNPAFAESLRAALPNMRFTPATLNGHRVRERVRQEFLFQLGPSPAPAKTTT
jgi:Gram-negative bacterial TonB protein C-terminal